jgi:amidase
MSTTLGVSMGARILSTQRKYPYESSAKHKPLISVAPGEKVIIEVPDAYAGRVVQDRELLTPAFFRRVLPFAGPIGVKGAEPGDWVAVAVESVSTASEGTLILRREKGLLGRYRTGPPVAFRFTVDGNTARHPALGDFPTAPMIGTVAVAPAHGTVPSLLAGENGGNLDCPEMGAGATMVLPVLTRGALVYLGDGHARMGHGELGGTGIEIALTVTARFFVVSGPRSHSKEGGCPLVVDRSPWVAAIGRGKSLDVAARRAVHGLRLWLGHLDCDEIDARIAVQGEVRVCQIVNNLFTVSAGITPHANLYRRVSGWLGQN